jgi:RHS repeat-associated protein
MYYYGYRFYDPGTQRWINRDPLGDPGFQTTIGSSGSGWAVFPNPFAFVRNDPLNLRDGLGLQENRPPDCADGMFRTVICTEACIVRWKWSILSIRCPIPIKRPVVGTRLCTCHDICRNGRWHSESKTKCGGCSQGSPLNPIIPRP